MSPVPESTAGIAPIDPIAPQSQGTSFGDHVTTAALAIAAGGFVITCLQALYEYSTSTLRDKCSTGAIGGWHKYTKTRWRFWGWYLSVKYPQVDLDIMTVLKVRLEEDRDRRKQLPHFDLPEKYAWKDTLKFKNEFYGFWDVWLGSHVCYCKESSKAVNVFELPLRTQIKWFKYLWTNPRYKPSIARASWANLITCVGVDPSEKLVRSREGADGIPSILDAPLQITTLANIALWCFVLGMKDVRLDLKQHTIQAENEFANIMTTHQTVPGASQIISLEGDFENLRALVAQASPMVLQEAVATANGSMQWGNFHASPYKSNPLHLVYALQNCWSQDTWTGYNHASHIEVAETLEFGNIISEAKMYKTGNKLANCEWTSFWTEWKVGACPSLIQCFAFLPYHKICSGFPLRSFLEPYAEVIGTNCKTWWTSEGEHLCYVDKSFYSEVALGNAHFLRRDKSFLLAVDGIGCNGFRSWIFHSCQTWWGDWNVNRQDQIERLNADGEFKSQFPILINVDRILRGESLDKVRKEPESVYAGNFVSVEAGLWLTLFTLEARIEVLWDSVQLQHKDGKHENAHPKDKSSRLHIPPSLAGFLGLWLMICHTVDPFSPRNVVENAFDSEIEMWREKDELCVPMPHHGEEWDAAGGSRGHRMTKREFYDAFGKRKDLMRRILPWLQLRSIVMYYYLLCSEDSSDVADALKSNVELRVRVA